MHKAEVTIAPYYQGKAVNHRSRLRGRVTPPNGKVYVFVFSHDGLWYAQKEARVHGRHWEADVCFGYSDDRTPSGSEFIAVAVVSSKKLNYTTLAEIPADLTQSAQCAIVRL